MKKIKVVMFAMMVVVLMLAGCSTTKKAVQAQAVDETVDSCAKCHMAVKNNGYAAQYVTEDGKSVKFDDIGCLEKYVKEHPEVKIAGKFIEDAKTKAWLNYTAANFVYAMSAPTPMGYGVHAFTEKATADQFAKDNKGQVLTAEQLSTHEWTMDKSKMMMGGSGSMNNNSNMNMGK